MADIFEGPVVRMPVSNLGERLRPFTEKLPMLTDRSAAHQGYYAGQLGDRPRQWTLVSGCSGNSDVSTYLPHISVISIFIIAAGRLPPRAAIATKIHLILDSARRRAGHAQW